MYIVKRIIFLFSANKKKKNTHDFCYCFFLLFFSPYPLKHEVWLLPGSSNPGQVGSHQYGLFLITCVMRKPLAAEREALPRKPSCFITDKRRVRSLHIQQIVYLTRTRRKEKCNVKRKKAPKQRCHLRFLRHAICCVPASHTNEH